MKVIDHIKDTKKTLFSFEILPPLKGKSIESIYEGIDPLLDFEPAFIDVTYHRQEYVYRKHANGLLEKVSVRKRPGTVGICAAIMNRYKIDAVPHLICGGFTREETENALIDLHFLGIDNVLALRGDNIKTEKTFEPEPDGNHYAIDLLKQIKQMNKGVYLDDELAVVAPTDFCAGVAGYPEKHFESPNMNTDLKYLKMKVDAGAEYIVTQMFFNNQKFFDFVDKCREIGINVPIIPGIKPITTVSQTNILPSIFHIEIPEALINSIENCKDEKAVKQVGIEWGIQQTKELIAHGVPCIHFYTMGKSESTAAIARGSF